MVWTHQVGSHFIALEKFFIMKVAFFFMSTKVTFQLLNRGHVINLVKVEAFSSRVFTN